MSKLTYKERRQMVRDRQVERFVDAWTGAGHDGTLWLPVLLAATLVIIALMLR
jgi:esterase/lipase superfamily enzyme